MINLNTIKISRLVAISFILSAAFLGCSLHGQSTQIISVKQTFDYPVPKGITIPIVDIYPRSLCTVPDSLPIMFKEYKYLKLGVDNLLPSDLYLIPFFQNNRLTPFLLRLLDGNKAVFILDHNGNGNFTEEKPDTIPTNQSVFLIKQFLITSAAGQPCPISLPLVINIDRDGQVFRSMEMQNLLKYELRCSLANTPLAIDIQAPYYRFICRYRDPGIAKDSLIEFSMNEPFRFKGGWYKLKNLDLCENTVELEKLEGNKIVGYKQGQYVDIALFQKLTDKNMRPGGMVDWSKKSYYLLHFWGEWCAHCVEETPEVKALTKHLEFSTSVQMIHYPYVMKKSLQDRTERSIKDNVLSTCQSYCILNECTREEAAKEQCDASTLLRVTGFPEYIILDHQGKIIYRKDKNNLQDVILKLQELGVY